MKEFAAKKCAKLGKLLKERGGIGVGMELKREDLPNASDLKPKLNPKSGNCSSVIKVIINTKNKAQSDFEHCCFKFRVS